MATLTTAHDFSNLPRNSILREPDPNMFSKLKHSFSRKEKDGRTSSMKSQNSHPHSNSTPSTRRPANLPSRTNPFRDMGEAPPPYSPPSNAPQGSQAVSITPSSSSQPATDAADDAYDFLRTFDTIFLIDDSGSMAGGRWRDTREALEKIAPICTKYDHDGVDIYFLNRTDSNFKNIKDANAVKEIFHEVKPRGGTPTGQRLDQILRPYLRRYEKNPETTKPINLICITDGEPSDDVESPLIRTAKKLDKLEAPAWQVGVQFFQVGRDEEAKKHLKQLDDELAEIAGDDELRDMIDTVPFKGDEGSELTAEGVLKVVLGSVHRKLDRKKSKDIHR